MALPAIKEADMHSRSTTAAMRQSRPRRRFGRLPGSGHDNEGQLWLKWVGSGRPTTLLRFACCLDGTNKALQQVQRIDRYDAVILCFPRGGEAS